MAKPIAYLENRLGQTNSKADLALESVQRVRTELKMVLKLSDGVRFASNSI